jgi:hypothetical protein
MGFKDDYDSSINRIVSNINSILVKLNKNPEKRQTGELLTQPRVEVTSPEQF